MRFWMINFENVKRFDFGANFKAFSIQGEANKSFIIITHNLFSINVIFFSWNLLKVVIRLPF